MSSVTNSQNKYKASQKVHQSTDSKVGTPDQVSPGFGTAKVIESQSVPTTPPVPAKEGGFHGFKSDSPYTGRSENLAVEAFYGFQTPNNLTSFQNDGTGSKENQSPGGFMTQALSTSSTKNDEDPVQADELSQVIQDLCLKGVSEPLSGLASQFDTEENHSLDASRGLTEEQEESYNTVMGLVYGSQVTAEGNLLILNGPKCTGKTWLLTKILKVVASREDIVLEVASNVNDAYLLDGCHKFKLPHMFV